MRHKLTSLLSTLAVAGALASGGSLAASQPAEAHHWSIDSFPRVSGAFSKGVEAWRGYLGHCVQSGIAIYGYESVEFADVGDAYAFVPDLYDCSIYFNVDKPKNYRRTWFCSVMVHEMGHVAGFEHTDDPNDIMNGPGEIYWRSCLSRRQTRRYARRGKIIDYSISQWTKQARVSGRVSATDLDHGHLGDHGIAEALEADRISAHRITTLPVR